VAGETYVFKAALVGFRGVSRKVALRGDETLADLHQLIQFAFDWDDDHLYSFWLSGEFWDRRPGVEFARPDLGLESGQRSARTRLDRLALQAGQKIAYVFDYGDEWRVRLTLSEIRPAGTDRCSAIIESRGDAPPQYGCDDEDLAETG
jgi:Plasmid pRiA4b ORF-3-like protein